MCLIITEINNYTERIKDTMGQLKQSRTWHKKNLGRKKQLQFRKVLHFFSTCPRGSQIMGSLYSCECRMVLTLIRIPNSTFNLTTNHM